MTNYKVDFHIQYSSYLPRILIETKDKKDPVSTVFLVVGTLHDVYTFNLTNARLCYHNVFRDKKIVILLSVFFKNWYKKYLKF